MTLRSSARTRQPDIPLSFDQALQAPRGFVFLVAALIVAVSRVYVGTHYVGDVLGGASTGIIAVFLARAIYWKDTRLDRFLTSRL
jgi:membrane-associated phospholipid phosphatase